jgi:hypothetical protein
MSIKKKTEKKPKKEVKESKLESKKKEVKESELEEEIKEEVELEPEIDSQKLITLLQTNVRTGSPVLEQVEVADRPSFSLEQDLEFRSSLSGKKADTKYETIKDLSQDYENPSKRQQSSSGEFNPISVSSHINMASVGRQPERIGREFHMTQPEELSHIPESIRKYETIKASSADEFKGEKTDFQQQMDKRYEVKK